MDVQFSFREGNIDAIETCLPICNYTHTLLCFFLVMYSFFPLKCCVDVQEAAKAPNSVRRCRGLPSKGEIFFNTHTHTVLSKFKPFIIVFSNI